MLYMVEKIFMQGVSFDIVNNELAHKNLKKFEKLFFRQGSEKIALFTNRF